MLEFFLGVIVGVYIVGVIYLAHDELRPGNMSKTPKTYWLVVATWPLFVVIGKIGEAMDDV